MKKFSLGVFLLLVSLTILGAEDDKTSLQLAESPGEEGAALVLSGSLSSLYTIGFAENDQKLLSGSGDGLAESKQNGFYTALNFSVLYKPVSFIELNLTMLARIRPGSPYIPMQMENAEVDNFSFDLYSGYGRINIIKGLQFDLPLDVYLKAGKFNTAPSNFQTVSQFGTESVLSKLRTKNTFAGQVEISLPLPVADSLSLTATANHQFGEELSELYDSDGSVASKGDPVLDSYALPLHVALKLNKLNLIPLGPLSAEFVYALNAEHIYSGQNFGASLGADLKLADFLTLPVGVGVAFYEKNIDALASTAVEKRWSGLFPYEGDTTGFRGTLRIGGGTGAKVDLPDLELKGALNLGFAWSQIAHIYRETMNVPSLSVDLRVGFQNRYFLGGGFIAGILNEQEWKTKEGVNSSADNFTHVFTFKENTGWEVFGGLQFNKSKFVLGYNNNRGLALNYAIEALEDSQYKYRQSGSISADGLLERGGVFIKFVTAW
jgi:hypothetical protein